MADFINEQKQSLLSPRDLEYAHEQLPIGELKSKLADLSVIYGRYQTHLQQHQLVDREGMGWLALDSMVDRPFLPIDLFVVDGYDQFTPLQAEVIAQLSKHTTETFVTLTTVPHRTDTIGKRFVQAAHNLQKACQQNGVGVQTESLPVPILSNLSDLQYLTQHIFRFGMNAIPSTGGVFFLASENELAETRQVLRRVKALLLYPTHSSTTPEDFIIVLRDYARYFPHLERVAHEYEIPLAMHLAQPLMQLPIIHLVFSLLQLHMETPFQSAFPKQGVLEGLRSPYLQVLEVQQLQALELVCQHYLVQGGRDTWRKVIEQSAKASFTDEDEQAFATQSLLDPILANEVAERLAHFFNIITPPQRATPAEYVLWVDRLIGQDRLDDFDDESSDGATTASATGYIDSLNLVQRVRTFSADEYASIELTALVQFKSVLRGLLVDSLFVSQTEGQPSLLTWAEFFVDLQQAIETATLQPTPQRDGKVLVTTAVNARGLPHQHVFIMGLSEGIFPQAIRSDVFLLDDERLRLRAFGLELETASERSADDGLFYELISQAQQSLTLSRPTTQKGVPWMPSHLWRGVEQVFTDAPSLVEQGTIGVAQLPTLEQVASESEWFLTVASLLNGTDSLTLTQPDYLNQAIAHAPDYWRMLSYLTQIEKGRISRRGDMKYRGHITDTTLKRALMQRYNGQHIWSASQLNELGVCGFRFFAGRVLQLQAYEEPTLGLSTAQLGTLNHTILQKLYASLTEQHVRIHLPELPRALSLLDELAEDVFNQAPSQLAFFPTSYWQEERQYILQHLRKLVQFDFTQLNDKLGIGEMERYPLWQEKSFGLGQKGLVLSISPDLEPIMVRGIVDRVDQTPYGAIVLDYKTGSTPIPTSELVEGRNFQMMLYIHATQTLLNANPSIRPQQVYGGAFLHIHSQKISGKLLLGDAEYDEQINRAKHALKQQVLTAREGTFSIEPSKPSPDGKCIAYCQFQHLCRLSQQR